MLTPAGATFDGLSGYLDKFGISKLVRPSVFACVSRSLLQFIAGYFPSVALSLFGALLVAVVLLHTEYLG